MELPTCPKCNSDMVPLSGPREVIGIKDYCLVFGEWKCVKQSCGYSVHSPYIKEA